MSKSKVIHKPCVKTIKPQERTARLLTEVEEERQYVKRNKLEKRFGAELDALSETLLNLPVQKNNLMILLKTEKELNTLRDEIGKAAHDRCKRWSLAFHIMVGIKVFAYMGAYFWLIPRSSFQGHPSIYIATGMLLLLVWIGYFYILEKSHWQLHSTIIGPLAEKYPHLPLRLASVCLFNMVSFSPLTTAVQVFPEFINPNWDVFLVNGFRLIVDIFTSNMITAAANGLAFLPFVAWLFSKVMHARRTE